MKIQWSCFRCMFGVVLGLCCGSVAHSQGLCLNAPNNFAAGAAPCSVIAIDLDGDGDRDLAVTNRYAYSVTVLINNGSGSYGLPVSYRAGSLGGDPWSLAAA